MTEETKDIFEERKEQFLELCESLADQFYKKNKDYGDAYFKDQDFTFEMDKRLSDIDFYCQIRRKFGRIANFSLKRLNEEFESNLVADETEEDTIRDMANYCIMELLKRKLKKERNGKK